MCLQRSMSDAAQLLLVMKKKLAHYQNLQFLAPRVNNIRRFIFYVNQTTKKPLI